MHRRSSAVLVLTGSFIAACPTPTVTATSCEAGQIEVSNGAGWVCQSPSRFLSIPQSPVCSAGTTLSWNGSAWACVAAPSSGLATHTIGPMTVYVRTDGSDSACNGTADNPASSVPNCAFASPQQAVNALPDVIWSPVQISIGSGTYNPPSGANDVLDVARAGSGQITIAGTGMVTFSGGKLGIAVYLSTAPVVLQNLTVTGASSDDIVVISSTATLNGITTTSAGAIGVYCGDNSSCTFTGVSEFSNNTDEGVVVEHQSMGAFSGGAATMSANGTEGLLVISMSSVDIKDGASVTVNNTSTSAAGVDVLRDAELTTDAMSSLTVTGAILEGLKVAESSTAVLQGALSVSVAQTGPGVASYDGSTLGIEADGGPITVTCASSSGKAGLYASDRSAVYTSGSGGITVSTCGSAVWSEAHSTVGDSGTGTRTTNSPKAATVETLSIYAHGSFPAAALGDCDTSSICL